MLIEHNLFGYVDKVQMAINDLKKYEPPEGYYVAFSGGKDSVVILDLVKRAGVKYEAHYHVMTIEPPELRKFVASHYPDVILDRAPSTMHKLIVKHGCPPLRIARYCCSELKSHNGTNRITVTGCRAEESPRRAKYQKYEPEYKVGGYRLNLILNWSADDVWEYIRQNNLSYCKLYDEGAKRIGCVFCPYKSPKENISNAIRYPQFVRYFVTACDRAIKIRIAKGKTSKYQTGAEMFIAWLEGGKGKKLADLGVYYDAQTFSIKKIGGDEHMIEKAIANPPTIETLTQEIKAYLWATSRNAIEIGKRLIQAKSLVRHGQWAVWLETNFSLSYRSARQFMQIAEHFGEKSDSQKWQTSAILNQSQMVEMLSLPVGEEEKFIEEQAAEGRIVAGMSVKKLRVEIQKYKAKLVSVNSGVESSVTVNQSVVSREKVEEPVQSENVLSIESVEGTAAVESGSDIFSDTGVVAESVHISAYRKDDQRVAQNSLEQFFGMMKALLSSGNLQELVEKSAEKDSQALEDELRQFAALYGDIQSGLSQWKRGKGTQVDSVDDETSVGEDVATVEESVVEETDVKTPLIEETAAVSVDKGGDNENSLESFVRKICDKKIDDVDDTDRHSIISALYRIMLTDDENFMRTEYIASLMEGKGFEVVHQMPTKSLYPILYFTALKFHIYT